MGVVVVRSLAERFHQTEHLSRSMIDLPRLPRPHELQPMGPLLWLEMTFAHGRRRETWDFSPRPWLAYSLPGTVHPLARMWVIGGAFEVGAEGFRNLRAPVGLQRIPVDQAMRRAPSQARRYLDTHYGAEPTQAVVGDLTRPKLVVGLGWLDAIAYETDRNDNDGLSPWRHPFAGDEAPLITTSASGRGLYFAGGSYTVKKGWLV